MDFNELVRQERVAQDGKWGEQNHEPLKWLGILIEEVGELATECININPENSNNSLWLEHELVQVAAVCKVIYESGKRNDWL